MMTTTRKTKTITRDQILVINKSLRRSQRTVNRRTRKSPKKTTEKKMSPKMTTNPKGSLRIGTKRNRKIINLRMKRRRTGPRVKSPKNPSWRHPNARDPI
ncbi:unnamed protein product, partial [Medioppia subpectinata]